MSEQELHVTTTKTPNGWKIEMDNNTWVQIMAAITGAITLEVKNGRGEGNQVHTFQALRQALSRVDHREDG